MGSTKHQEPLVISSLMTPSTSHTPFASHGHASKPSDDSDKTDSDTSMTSGVSCSPSAPPESPSRGRTFYNHMMADVKPSLMAEFELVVLTFSTGIQDAASFPDYKCFTSNQTGNTVFLMVALVMPELSGNLFITANIGASLGFFLAGAWITGQLSHFVGPRRRLWLVLCNFLQACMVFAAAGIQYKYGIDLQGSRTIGVIGLLAFSAGSQIVQSRSLSMIEISTAMATAAWVDVMVDKRMFILKGNRPQCRRIGFLVALVVGALVGAAVYRMAGSAIALYVSAASKLMVSIIYLFNSSEQRKVEESKV
ncbi:hypothetical protein F503_06329 [Ophiostoma piceae UAMH 11346]|uniref:DUF1275 domain protein n=1 Tax=Ophiostoma piceae (strain UAMH 11346) TaxID=1262450 RepID=S3CVJ0_OPHP1|nr:hypothetical protein F503_06329 [Ophiostoma piceae UAMH 11346]